MNLRFGKKRIIIFFSSVVCLSGILVFWAYARTWNKTDLEFRIHINEKLVKESTFGESPTFAIWLEDPLTGSTHTIFVTNRAGLNDWEGKAAVPVALPKWFEIDKAEKKGVVISVTADKDKIAITGATPKPGYFNTRARVKPGSKWICWIEVNLAGDYNDHYLEYDEVNKIADEFKTGQPALLYKAEIEATLGNSVKPELAGMCLLDSLGKAIIRDTIGITTALGIFDEMNVIVSKPRPRIIEK